MSSPSTSEEVAADFKDCLADLHDNNRWAIENLTQIARENVEHAQAISRALEEHIKKVNTWTTLEATASMNVLRSLHDART